MQVILPIIRVILNTVRQARTFAIARYPASSKTYTKQESLDSINNPLVESIRRPGPSTRFLVNK